MRCCYHQPSCTDEGRAWATRLTRIYSFKCRHQNPTRIVLYSSSLVLHSASLSKYQTIENSAGTFFYLVQTGLALLYTHFHDDPRMVSLASSNIAEQNFASSPLLPLSSPSSSPLPPHPPSLLLFIFSSSSSFFLSLTNK